MGFNSYDDLVSELTAGKTTGPVTWNKLVPAAHTIGRWYDFSSLAGTPIANAWAGTALNWVTCTGSTGNGTQIFGLPMGSAVTPDTKHILNAMALTPGVVPGVLMLLDLQGYWPGITNNSLSAQTLVGTPTLRYTNGAGCRLFAVQTATNGATAQNIAISYTDQDGNTGNALPVTVGMTASTIASHISHSGVAANNYGPFLPLASGDSGVRNVATVTMSAANTGTFALCLARPLLTLPITTTGVAVERDLVNQLPSMPRIYDDACLTWLYFAGGTTASNTNFYGTVEAAWG